MRLANLTPPRDHQRISDLFPDNNCFQAFQELSASSPTSVDYQPFPLELDSPGETADEKAGLPVEASKLGVASVGSGGPVGKSPGIPVGFSPGIYGTSELDSEFG